LLGVPTAVDSDDHGTSMRRAEILGIRKLEGRYKKVG